MHSGDGEHGNFTYYNIPGTLGHKIMPLVVPCGGAIGGLLRPPPDAEPVK